MNSFTFGYVCFQFIVGLLAFSVLWWKKGWYTHTNTVASILTIIGVFGTFVGIFIGLQVFEIENLESSIPGLLNGLKLAFLTSLVGILEAIVLKGYAFVYQMIRSRDPSQEAINQFVEGLKEALVSVETSGESNLSSKLDDLTKAIKNGDDIGTVLSGISDIKTALTGEAERTIFTQLQNLSKVVSDTRLHTIETSLSDNEGNLLTELRSLKKETIAKHDDLKSEFQTFSKNVAESVAKLATDELIDALKAVIEDFNAKITEQFGDNFKHLNEAVGKTVAWQEQYRHQMEELADEFRVAAESIEVSRSSLENIADSSNTIAQRSSSIVACAENMEPLLHTLNSQLEAFSELRQRAHEAFPLIENRLNDLTISFSDTVKAAIADSHASMEKQRTALTTQADQLQKDTNETSLRITELTIYFTDTVKASIAEAQSSLNQQQTELTARFGELETTMNLANKQIQQTLNDVSEQLDSVFEKSANHITHVTTGFTQNLTQQLQNILEDQVKELGNIVERNKEDIENHVNILHNALRKEVNTLNESLREELTNSLQKLAGNFESLSNGFVNNYTELVKPYTQVLTSLTQFVDASRNALREGV